MKNYLAYIRVSTVKQGEHGCSLSEQRGSIEAYAARHGLKITEWFEEQETAAKQGRREFARLTDLLKRGKAAGAIIHKIDRSARNLKDWAGLGELIDAGVEVLFAHEGLDMQTRGGRLAADIQAVVAADFIRNLRQEVRKGFYGRLKQGFYPMRAPRGYVDNGKAKVKTPHPLDGPLVSAAFTLYATGTHSLDTLRHELARQGLCRAGNQPLSFNGMSTMLRNSFYIGLIRIGTTGETFAGKHEPLTTKATFDRVQAVLDGRLYPRLQLHSFRYRRLIKCQTCNRSLTGERHKGHVYYRCHDRGCRGVSLTERGIEQAVLGELIWLALGQTELGDLRDLFGEQIALEQADKHKAAAQVEREIAAVDLRLQRLTDVLIDGMIDKATFDERKAQLLGQQRALKDRLASGANSTFWQTVAEMFELGLTASSGYILAPDEKKREALQIFGSNLSVATKTPYFTMQFPFDVIANWAKSHDGEPYKGVVRTRELIELLAKHQSPSIEGISASP